MVTGENRSLMATIITDAAHAATRTPTTAAAPRPMLIRWACSGAEPDALTFTTTKKTIAAIPPASRPRSSATTGWLPHAGGHMCGYRIRVWCQRPP